MGGRSPRGCTEAARTHGLAEDLPAGQDCSRAWRRSHDGNKEQKAPPNSSRKHLPGFLDPSHTKHFSNEHFNSGIRHRDIIRGHNSVSFWELSPGVTGEPLVPIWEKEGDQTRPAASTSKESQYRSVCKGNNLSFLQNHPFPTPQGTLQCTRAIFESGKGLVVGSVRNIHHCLRLRSQGKGKGTLCSWLLTATGTEKGHEAPL